MGYRHVVAHVRLREWVVRKPVTQESNVFQRLWWEKGVDNSQAGEEVV